MIFFRETFRQFFTNRVQHILILLSAKLILLA
ncbi:Uncharacterised protein [Segatella copri]|nr:Uncharacterised protein [Segatella copri]